jgi:UDP-glucose 4-epimerase
MAARRAISECSVLVTGGAGFIGSHLVNALLDRGARRVVVVDNLFLGTLDNLATARDSDRFVFYREDAAELPAMDRILADHGCEVVFNLATKALLYSFQNPEGAFDVNTNIMRTLLYLQRKGAFQTLVHTSSSEAYGSAVEFPMSEEHPYVPATPYAAGKAAADLMAMSYVHTFQSDVSIVRPFNNYGPRQNMNRGLEAIIPLTAARIMRGESPVLHGDGLQTRDFMYVDDTIRGILAAYDDPASRGEVLNLASGIETPIRDVIDGICDYFGYRGPIDQQPPRAADVRRHRGDISKAQRLIAFAPTIEFKSGLKKTLDWYTDAVGYVRRPQVPRAA